MLENGLVLEQKQVLSANQVQSLEVLAYTNQELDNFLTNEYLENPLLEHSADKQDEMLDNLEKMYEKGTSYKEQYAQWEDEDCDRKGDVRAKNSGELRDFILGQLHQKNYTDREWRLMGYLIQCLDEKGFFVYEVADIAEASGYSQKAIEKCLGILKELEPAGIFSGNISECLVKQLETMGVDDENLLAMVDKYMPDVLEGHIGVVSRELHLSTAKVKEYIHLIGGLNPRPIMNMQSQEQQYVIPDILVSHEEGGWKIEINDKWLGGYKYNDYYMNMMQQAKDEELKHYFRERLERARFVLNCVEQRRTTIIKIVKAILEIQEGYFLNNETLKPMCLEDIALKADMHISTVSRAVKGKYIQYKKTVLLKDLFNAASSAQEDISIIHIKQRIADIIKSEDRSHPLSDLKVAELLVGEGHDVSRRTVAKYRGRMGIPGSRQRLYLP